MGESFRIYAKNTELLSFLIRTVTVGTGISPVQHTRADFTADVEFHQPPKNVGKAHLKMLAVPPFLYAKQQDQTK